MTTETLWTNSNGITTQLGDNTQHSCRHLHAAYSPWVILHRHLELSGFTLPVPY